MARDLGESPLRMQSVVIAYALTMAMLIPASGWLADRFGTRRAFFGAILLFMAGSLLCALSHSVTQLVVARVIQGAGGAMLLPVGRLSVLRAFPREKFLRAMSFVAVPGHGRPADRTDAGRLAGRSRVLALDLPHQHPDRPRRRHRHARLDAGRPRRRGAALRRHRLPAAGDGHGGSVAVARRPVGAGHAPRRGAGADDLRLRLPDRLLAARRAAARSAVFTAAVPHPYLQHRPAWQSLRAHRQRQHAVPDPAAAAGQPRLFALASRADDDPGGRRRDPLQAPRHPADHARGLSQGAGDQHHAGRPRHRQFRAVPSGKPAVAAHRAAGDLRRGEFAAVHGDEHHHAEGPGHRRREQRQQPAVDGADGCP